MSRSFGITTLYDDLLKRFNDWQTFKCMNIEFKKEQSLMELIEYDHFHFRDPDDLHNVIWWFKNESDAMLIKSICEKTYETSALLSIQT